MRRNVSGFRGADWLTATVFGVIAVALFRLAIQGGWYLVSGWPGVSVAMVTLAYLTGNVGWFGKRGDGSRSRAAQILLLPALTVIRIVWLVQISLSGESPANAVNRFLFVSRALRVHEVPRSVTDVCDLTCELTDPTPIRRHYHYRCLPILDAGIRQASEQIELARELPPAAGRVLLIHCANGHGRTGMFAAIWLLTHGFAGTAAEALGMLHEIRPGIVLRRRQQRMVGFAESILRNSNIPAEFS